MRMLRINSRFPTSETEWRSSLVAQQVKDLGCHCWAGVQSLAWEFLRALGMSKKESKKRNAKKCHMQLRYME